MTYFSLPLSQKLESLGITGEGLYGYYNIGRTDGVKTWDHYELRSTDFMEATNPDDPAISMSDVFHKEALIKMFQEGKWSYDGKTAVWVWKYHRDRMIETYSEEGLPALETYLEENLI